MNPRHLLRLLRLPTLVATAVPLLIGGALALSGKGFSFLSWADIFFVALLMQVGTNALNEYGDYRHAVDTAPTPGIAGVIVSGEVGPREVLLFAITCYAASFVLGILLVFERGLLLLVLGSAAILVGILYSEGPLPISSTPFGELVVAIVMGPVEVVSANLAASGEMSPLALVCSVPVALLVACILLANNLRDIENDHEHGRRTIAVILGRSRGSLLLLVMMLAAFAWSLPAYALFSAPPWVFLIWLAFPLAAATYRSLSQGNAWAAAVPLVARVHIVVGMLLAISLLLHFP